MGPQENKDTTELYKKDMTNQEERELVYHGGAKVTLKLGDIIQIYSPQNSQIHEQTFFIEYIDETVAILLDIATLTQVQLETDDDGNIRDETIQNIYILSHATEEGYARQNGLVPKIWVDIYIGGDVPSIITGEITNLEQDMIEVTTFPEMDVIYVDFAYKGLPRDIPIQYFEIRNRPSSLESSIDSLADISKPEDMEREQDTETPKDGDGNRDETYIQLDQTDLPEKDMFHVLNSMYVNADGLVLGEELEDIAQLNQAFGKKTRNVIADQYGRQMQQMNQEQMTA